MKTIAEYIETNEALQTLRYTNKLDEDEMSVIEDALREYSNTVIEKCYESSKCGYDGGGMGGEARCYVVQSSIMKVKKLIK